MAIAGLRGTGSWGTDERPTSFREGILWQEPSGTPLFALTSKVQNEKVDDVSYHWWEETLKPLVLRVNQSGVTASTTAITVDEDANAITKGDILMVDSAQSSSYTQELLLVTADPTSDTGIVVQRALGAASGRGVAAAIADNTNLIRISSATEEGAGPPRHVSNNPRKVDNYTQIFRTKSYEITRTADKTKTRTGKAMKNDIRRNAFVHSEKIEKAFFFGRPSISNNGGKVTTTTGGLSYFITSNRKHYTDALTYANFVDDTRECFRYTSGSGSRDRLCFMGDKAYNAFCEAVRKDSGVRINFDATIEDVYGVKLKRWMTPHGGDLYFMVHPLFSVTSDAMSQMVFIVNMGDIICNRITDTIHREVKMEDRDDLKDLSEGEYLSEMGLEVHHENTMCVLSGVHS